MDIFQKLIKLFIDGGPIVMTCILIASLIGMIIIIERILYFKKISKNDEKIIDRIHSALEKERYDEALAICETAPSPVTNLMKAGIKYRDFSEHQIQEAIKDAANLEVPKLDKHISTLGTVASVAPLLGLYGTVIGNMQAFGIIGAKSAIGSMEMLAGGIAKALLTTAFGLLVAIPASIFYNYLTNKVSNMILALEIKANELVLMLVKNKKRNVRNGL